MQADPVSRFEAIVGAPATDTTLIDGALEIARAANPSLDPALVNDAIDRLAAGCPGDPCTPGSVMSHLFSPSTGDQQPFRGNTEAYYDPRNSYIDQVIRRRLGIPITLAVVGIEVARRCGVTVVGISMPGHFLLGTTGASTTFYDPFDGGKHLSVGDCEARFRSIQPPGVEFTPAFLDPVVPASILLRMLNNLVGISRSTKDRTLLTWALQFQARFNGADPKLAQGASKLLATQGQYPAAAAELERLAQLHPGEATAFNNQARALRARLN